MIPRDVPVHPPISLRTVAALGAAALTLVTGTAIASGFAATPAAAVPSSDAATPDLLVTSSADTGEGTLRAALDLANTTPGAQTIGFAAGVTTVTLERPLLSTDAVTLAGTGVTVLAGPEWAVTASVPGGPRSPDVLLHAQRSALTLHGITLDAAQIAESAVFLDAPGGADTVSIAESTLRDATGSALVIAGAQASIAVDRSTLVQQATTNRAAGIVGADSSAAAITVTDSTITGFGASAASFEEWNPVPGTDAQIRFERSTLADNGRIDDPAAAAGGIVLEQSQELREAPRLVVQDSMLARNAGHAAGGITVSTPRWDAPGAARSVEITGSTFQGNLGYDADDLSELPEASFAAARADEGTAETAETAGTAEDTPTADKPVIFDVSNSTFVGTEEFPSRVLSLNNPATRSTFDQVTVLRGFVAVGYWIESPVFEMQDTVIDAGDWDPINIAQPARSAPAETSDAPAQPAVALSLRSAYVDAAETGLPQIQGSDDVVVRSAEELRLGTLADNGGHTPTVLPADDSPLVDAGEAGAGQEPDQRGVARPQGPRSDIGAVEVAEPPVTEPGTDPGTEPSTEPSTDPGTDPSTEPSTDPGTDPSTDPGTDPATDPSTDPTTEPTTDPSSDPSTDPGTDPSTDPASDPTTDPGTAPGTEPSAPAERGDGLAQTGASSSLVAWGLASAIAAVAGAVLLIARARPRRG